MKQLNVWLHLTIRLPPNDICVKSRYGTVTYAEWCKQEMQRLRQSEKNGREFSITTDFHGLIGINHLIKQEEIKHYHE